MKYAQKTLALGASPIRDMMTRAAQIEDVISFAVGQPDFLPQPSVIQAACASLERGDTVYTPGAGLGELRRAYARYVSETVGTPYAPEEIAVTAGGMSALFLSLNCLLEPGDEVLLPSPYWTNYAQQVILCGGVPIMVEVEEANDFVITAQDICAAIGPKTRVLMLNSPCNPTGSVISKETLRQLAATAVERDLFVISDEVYRHILFDGAKFTSISEFPGMKERTLIVDSCSKAFAMPGFRVGFAAGPRELIELMVKITEDVYSCIPGFVQYAAIEALTHGAQYRDEMVREYERRRNYVVERLNAMPGISCVRPRGAFYVFANIGDTGLAAPEFCDRLLEEGHVAVVPGNTFGSSASGYVRISYALSMERIKLGLDRMERFAHTLEGKK